MGASQSKEQQQPQTKVFLPSTPTEFSNGLISKLDTTVESDYTRSQYTEKHIQDQVSQELQKIEQDAVQALKKASESLPDPKSDGNKGEEDGNTLRHKIGELRQKLDSRPAPRKLDKDLSNSRDQLVKCFKDNKDKPLNCWEEFDAFKKQVQKQL